MPYSIYDSLDQIAPIFGALTPTAPTGLSGLFQDRNFLSLLAGIGQGLDPKGVGGAIGGPTRLAIASQAAQERSDKQTAAQNAQTKMLLDVLRQHKGATPQGIPGVTEFKALDDGGVQFKIDPPAEGLEQPIAPAAAPTTPSAPTYAPPTVTPTAPGTAPTGAVAPTTPRNMVDLISPFYSALLQLNRGL
jgi:hypothetical protein